MRKLKPLLSLLLLIPLISLQGCFFIFIPIGPIIRAIQGPRYCVSSNAVIGSHTQASDGRWITVTKIHGPDSACVNPSTPVLVNVVFDKDEP